MVAREMVTTDKAVFFEEFQRSCDQKQRYLLARGFSLEDCEDFFATIAYRALKSGTYRELQTRALVQSYLDTAIYRQEVDDRIRKQSRCFREGMFAACRRVFSWDEIDDRLQLEACLRTLPEQYRLPIFLTRVLDCTDEEAAQVMGITKIALKTRLPRAMALLERHYAYDSIAYITKPVRPVRPRVRDVTHELRRLRQQLLVDAQRVRRFQRQLSETSGQDLGRVRKNLAQAIKRLNETVCMSHCLEWQFHLASELVYARAP